MNSLSFYRNLPEEISVYFNVDTIAINQHIFYSPSFVDYMLINSRDIGRTNSNDKVTEGFCIILVVQ